MNRENVISYVSRLFEEWLAFGQSRDHLLPKRQLNLLFDSVEPGWPSTDVLAFLIESIAVNSHGVAVSVMRRSCEWLERAERGSAVEAMERTLDSPSVDAQVGALRLLEVLGWPEVMAAVTARLATGATDAQVQRSALLCLRAHRAALPEATARVLLDESRDWMVRLYAAEYVGDGTPICLAISDGSEFSDELQDIICAAGYRVIDWQADIMSWQDAQHWPEDLLERCALVTLVRGEHYARHDGEHFFSRLVRYVRGGGVLFATAWVCWESRDDREFSQILPFSMGISEYQEDALATVRAPEGSQAHTWFPRAIQVPGSFEFVRVNDGAEVWLVSSDGNPVLGHRAVDRGATYYFSACQHSCLGRAVSPLAGDTMLKDGFAGLFAELRAKTPPVRNSRGSSSPLPERPVQPVQSLGRQETILDDSPAARKVRLRAAAPKWEIGNYRIIRQIGGGMDIVYEAEHTTLGKRAVVKMIRAERLSAADAEERFMREAKVLALVDHPGVVDIYEFGRHSDGSLYLVMPLLQGESLENRLARDGRLSAAKGLSFALQVARTLGAVHHRGIIHRDLKPDNIFLVPDREVADGERVKLLDFGIAKLLDATSGATQSGVIMGTPAYMAPEQCQESKRVDARADLYSLGVILFRMIAGRLPFEKKGSLEYLMAHVVEPAPSILEFAPGLPLDVARVIERLLAKDPADRFASADELSQVLDNITRAPPSHTPIRT